MGSITSPTANNLLKWKHPVKAMHKPANPQYFFPKVPGVNPYWEGEFKFSNKG